MVVRDTRSGLASGIALTMSTLGKHVLRILFEFLSKPRFPRC